MSDIIIKLLNDVFDIHNVKMTILLLLGLYVTISMINETKKYMFSNSFNYLLKLNELYISNHFNRLNNNNINNNFYISPYYNCEKNDLLYLNNNGIIIMRSQTNDKIYNKLIHNNINLSRGIHKINRYYSSKKLSFIQGYIKSEELNIFLNFLLNKKNIIYIVYDRDNNKKYKNSHLNTHVISKSSFYEEPKIKKNIIWDIVDNVNLNIVDEYNIEERFLLDKKVNNLIWFYIQIKNMNNYNNDSSKVLSIHELLKQYINISKKEIIN